MLKPYDNSKQQRINGSQTHCRPNAPAPETPEINQPGVRQAVQPARRLCGRTDLPQLADNQRQPPSVFGVPDATDGSQVVDGGHGSPEKACGGTGTGHSLSGIGHALPRPGYSLTTEADLAAVVVAWLRDAGWRVYQEVQVHTHGRCADIVAVQGSIVWVIESKLSLSLDVVEQALKWQGNAHYVSVAVPHGIRRSQNLFDHNLIHEVLTWKGVGLILVEETGAAEFIHPLLRRRINAHPLRDALRDRQQDYAPAGNANNQHWSAFKETCETVATAVRDRPGQETSELLSRVKHHWKTTTAEGNLFQLGQHGGIPGVEMRYENRKWRWYPKKDGRNILTNFL